VRGFQPFGASFGIAFSSFTGAGRVPQYTQPHPALSPQPGRNRMPGITGAAMVSRSAGC
jgi:hypothetical protein